MMKYKIKELKARQQHELRMVRSHAAGTDTSIGSFDTPTPTATHSYSYPLDPNTPPQSLATSCQQRPLGRLNSE
jgi:hypothetical protein